MRVSLQIKFLAVCVFLVFLTAIGISVSYYDLTKQDKQSESQQRIQIAFDFMLTAFENRVNTYTERVNEFLTQNDTLHRAALSYHEDRSRVSSISFISTNLAKVVDELKLFGHVVSAERLALYGTDKRLLTAYQREGEGETTGIYAMLPSGNDAYLPMNDSAQLTSMLFGRQPVPEDVLPSGIPTSYAGDIPDALFTTLFTENKKLGIRLTGPVFNLDTITGVLIVDVLYTQNIVKQYASLSKTQINLFAKEELSVGTLPAQSRLSPEITDQMVLCENLLDSKTPIEILSVTLNDQEYYQGQCAFRSAGTLIGVITISLSQEMEKQEIRKALIAILKISGIAIGAACVLSFILSHKPIRSIQNIVKVIGIVAEGDLRESASAMTHDEIGTLAAKLNQMITQLRTLYRQIHETVHSIHATSGVILTDMQMLADRMEQQSATVDNTTDFVERIDQFITIIGTNTAEQLSTAELVLSSIQQIRASLEEVTASTGHLAANTQHISSSVEQVNQTAQHISESSEHLDRIVRQTETEIHHIDRSFQDISRNANQSEQLAKETMNAAQSGQVAVAASIEGIKALKEVISHSAETIQEVNTSGEQINSILDIVDDITEQTSLLSLNASIISAQAGEHGRGFAIVANEIKDLALRTKVSTKEIASLIHTLQTRTEDSVASIEEGIAKADDGLQLVSAVKDELNTILERATQTSSRATDTAKVVQQTAESSQVIKSSMKTLTEMVAKITNAIQEQKGNIAQVVTAVENIKDMSGQVNLANREQNKASEMIVNGMEEITEKLGDISGQAKELKSGSDQILAAMHTIESITKNVLAETIEISGNTVRNMDKQINMLGEIVTVFKVP
ncbi:MAG: HAMP domain-containing protein [bacterium]|nr:HAMP domain-containing protein [bacterium]